MGSIEYTIKGVCSNCHSGSSITYDIPTDFEKINVGCKGCDITVKMYLPGQGRTVAYKGYGISVEISRQ